MGWFDWLTGNRKPDPNVPRCSAEDLKRALIAAAPADAPWQVRAGGEGEADVVAEWKLADETWRAVFFKARLQRTFRVLMRLDDATGTVRSVDQDVSVGWSAGVPQISFSATGFRGQEVVVGGSATFGTKADGSFGKLDGYRFSTGDMKDPLRRIVAESGWGWHGVAFAKL